VKSELLPKGRGSGPWRRRATQAIKAAMTDRPMSDRDIYLKLSAVARQLSELAEAAESYVGNAALVSASETLSGTARVIYEHCLNAGEDEVH
jgi:hypothetical protein